jgi:DNA-binding CsgD family transcriptional regulator
MFRAPRAENGHPFAARGAPPFDRLGGMHPEPALFVGRGRELERLRGHLDRATAGAGSIAMLVGEAGIGKSSAAFAFAADARARGASVLTGACVEGDGAAALLPWSEALRQATRAIGVARVREALGPMAAALGPIVPELRDTHGPLPLPPRDARLRLHDAVARLLTRAAEAAPLLLVLEDLHWADADSLALLLHVARFTARARWMILGTYRGSEAGVAGRSSLPELLATLRRESGYDRILLRGFALGELTDYLTYAAGRELPAATARLVFDETVGNPFYVREVVRHLLEEGRVLRVRGGGGAPESDVRELGIPGGVRDVVARRLARLSDDTRSVLRLASAMVSGADFALLDAVSDLGESDLLDCIDEAVRAGMAHGAGTARYAISHALVRRTLYDSVAPDRRAPMHRRIAEALETAAGPGGAMLGEPGEIASHYQASAALHGRDAGIPHALAAAAEATCAAAYERAVGFLRLARELATQASPLERGEVLRQLAMAEAQAGLGDDARATVDEAIPELEAMATPREDLGSFLSLVARELKAAGAPAAAVEPLVTRGLAIVGKKRDRVWARLKLLEEGTELLASGAVHVVRFAPRDAQAVRIARERGDEDDYAATLDHAYRTRAETEATRTAARGWVRPPALLRAGDAVARDLIYRHGEFRLAKEELERTREIAARAGCIGAEADALLQLAHCHAALGSMEAARTSRSDALAMAARLGEAPRALRASSIALDAMMGYLVGCDWRPIAEPAARIAADPAAGRTLLAHVAAGVAVLGYALAGYARESRSLLVHLAPVFERCDPHVFHYGVALDCAAMAVWHLGATDLAGRYRHLIAVAAPDAGTAPFTVRPLNAARMAILLEDWDAAGAMLAEARAVTERDGLLPLRAIVDHDEATALQRASAADGPGASARTRELLTGALAEFRALGMAPWVAHTHQLLGAEPGVPDLTAREVDIVRLVAEGRSNKEIAAKLLVTAGTVQRNLSAICGKIGVRGRDEVAAYARKALGAAEP